MVYPDEHNKYFNIDPTMDVPDEYFETSGKVTIQSALNKKDTNDNENEGNDIDEETRLFIMNTFMNWINATGFDLSTIMEVVNDNVSDKEKIRRISKIYKDNTRLSMTPLFKNDPNVIPMLRVFDKATQNIDLRNVDKYKLFESVINEEYKFCRK